MCKTEYVILTGHMAEPGLSSSLCSSVTGSLQALLCSVVLVEQAVNKSCG